MLKEKIDLKVAIMAANMAASKVAASKVASSKVAASKGFCSIGLLHGFIPDAEHAEQSVRMKTSANNDYKMECKQPFCRSLVRPLVHRSFRLFSILGTSTVSMA